MKTLKVKEIKKHAQGPRRLGLIYFKELNSIV